MPRYGQFTPDLVGYAEAALVRAKCHDCGQLYNIAVTPMAPLFHRLQTVLAYKNHFGVGDSPNGCRLPCAGSVMSMIELEILEFWTNKKPPFNENWARNPDLERPLYEAKAEPNYSNDIEDPVYLRIYNSEWSDAWRRARADGDYPQLLEILKQIGSAHPEAVAMMVLKDVTHERIWREMRKMKVPPHEASE